MTTVTVERHPLLLQAFAALERGQGADAVELLIKASRDPRLPRSETTAVRCGLAEAWLQQDDLPRAAEALGKQPDELRERLEPSLLSNLWRLHARLATARGEPSRAIALLGRALRHAERAHDSRAIGLAQYELAICYRQVGDAAIVREHLNKAAPALHAAGDRRHIALVHSLSGITFAQEGRFDDAMSALRQAERFAGMAGADDVVATVCGNQANVALMQHRYEQALALADRSVSLQEQVGSPHGLAVALASLGQICVRVGNLARAEQVLNRALDIPSPTQFRRETRGAVLDTLAQIHLIRGDYRAASDCLRQAREAYGEYGLQTSRWYEWSIRVLEARVALREGRIDDALAAAEETASAAAAPPIEALEAGLAACEAMLAAGRLNEASERLADLGARIEPAVMPGLWGEFLRVRGSLHARLHKPTEAYHDLSQSVSVFDLLGERYQAGLSQLALGSLAGSAGARSRARKHLSEAAAIFEALNAQPDLADARDAALAIPTLSTADYVGPQVDGDDAVVRRLVDAAGIPDLLGREAAAAILESCDAESVVLFVAPPGTDPRVLAFAGCDAHTARALAGAAVRAASYGPAMLVEQIGRDADGPRYAVVTSLRSFSGLLAQRFRTICAVTRQGFDLGRVRGRGAETPEKAERSLEPLLPGFVCASPAMSRVVELIQRLQGNDLTVLITGESGTGKDLVARAIHAGSTRRAATFLPFNCTTATRELADSQLFGHRRGAFTGAVSDQPGVIKSAAGGTLFLDEVGDLPLDVQPKLLRFLEQGEILPVGETRPSRVDVRVIAATNTDLEQRVAEGRFREDFFYRLSVIRIHVPPLRDRREEIPHLSTYFVREASERLGKPDVRLAPETLDLFDAYNWPGNVRQLRNEIHRAVAMSPAGSSIGPEHLSPALAALNEIAPALKRGRRQSLAAAVEKLEREMIRAALDDSSGNISETARLLGLTRRGLYLKLQRLGIAARV
ncbi:MAG TPA: sigma 54-interacting transcriptional regulator [Vicinamibacterales bacterium]|nr:sigma 54-interacting transcriptional regulator [Vicinamibacterales bacterium]